MNDAEVVENLTWELYDDLRERIHQLELEKQLDEAFYNLDKEKHDREVKKLFEMIVDVSRNGELTFHKGQRHGPQIVLAFDGDDAGRAAVMRFVEGQMKSKVKKGTIGELREKVKSLTQTVAHLYPLVKAQGKTKQPADNQPY